MDDLPELPFEQILRHLSLEDRLKLRAVSRTLYYRINGYPAKNLCFSDRPSGFILGKRRLINGAFVQNFISSRRFASFFHTFSQTILSNLKRLRLCDLRLNEENRAAFACSLNSFGQLQELDIIRFGHSPAASNPKMKIQLNLPVLQSIHLKEVRGIEKLALDAPKLKNVKCLASFPLRVYLVHGESVERLLVDRLEHIEVNNLKNLKNLKNLTSLKYLYIHKNSIDPTLLSDLKQLKEIHLFVLDLRSNITELFSQKQRLGRTELKVYVRGLLLSGPDDPAIDSLLDVHEGILRCLAENPSRLADEIPFEQYLHYTVIEQVALGREINLVKRLADLKEIYVHQPVQDSERFLDLLKNLDNIQELQFFCDQPQDLFDRLPEHSTVQRLTIESAPSDFRFLFRLENLVYLFLNCSTDAETVRHLFEKLPFLTPFRFKLNDELVLIETDHSKRFRISVDGDWREAADLNAVIEFVSENTL